MLLMIETAFKVEKIMAFLVETGLSPKDINYYMSTVEDKADASRRARMRRIISNFIARAIKGAYPEVSTYTYFRDQDDVRDYGSSCLRLPAVGVYYMIRKRYRNLDVAIIAAQCGVRLPKVLQRQAVARVVEQLEKNEDMDIEREVMNRIQDFNPEQALSKAEEAWSNIEAREELVNHLKDGKKGQDTCLDFILKILPAIQIEKVNGKDDDCDWEISNINFSDFSFRKEDVRVTLNDFNASEEVLRISAWDISAHFYGLKECTGDAIAEGMSLDLAFRWQRPPADSPDGTLPQLVMCSRKIEMVTRQQQIHFATVRKAWPATPLAKAAASVRPMEPVTLMLLALLCNATPGCTTMGMNKFLDKLALFPFLHLGRSGIRRYLGDMKAESTHSRLGHLRPWIREDVVQLQIPCWRTPTPLHISAKSKVATFLECSLATGAHDDEASSFGSFFAAPARPTHFLVGFMDLAAALRGIGSGGVEPDGVEADDEPKGLERERLVPSLPSAFPFVALLDFVSFLFLGFVSLSFAFLAFVSLSFAFLAFVSLSFAFLPPLPLILPRLSFRLARIDALKDDCAAGVGPSGGSCLCPLCGMVAL
eukprot:s1545_g8.t1